MAKRKRETDQDGHPGHSKQSKAATTVSKADSSTIAIQIITGSYEKTLHGVVALIPREASKYDNEAPRFFDNFLFDAHSSVVRCLALSPISKSSHSDFPSLLLASGGSDERINLFQLSALSPANDPSKQVHKAFPKSAVAHQKPANREIGSLLHHSSGLTKLFFPNRKKLLSAAGDNVIAISRTQDWTLLSTIKAPIPVPYGRPSGDTISLGDSPAGFNDFAVHPSLKLMLSVGKGEKCMRLWNLITGKKAGVLSFESTLLRQLGEGKRSSGEGRKIVWNPKGDAFVIGFERGAALFSMDSIPKAVILPTPLTKIHQICYMSIPSAKSAVLAVSTEDGRVLFYTPWPFECPTEGDQSSSSLRTCQPFAQLGGSPASAQGRIKDFEYLSIVGDDGISSCCTFVTCGSNGLISVWHITNDELMSTKPVRESEDAPLDQNDITQTTNSENDKSIKESSNLTVQQVGKLLGSYETSERITCLKAFVMQNAANQPGVDDEGAELDFDGIYHDNTPKSDMDEYNAALDDSDGGSQS